MMGEALRNPTVLNIHFALVALIQPLTGRGYDATLTMCAFALNVPAASCGTALINAAMEPALTDGLGPVVEAHARSLTTAPVTVSPDSLVM